MHIFVAAQNYYRGSLSVVSHLVPSEVLVRKYHYRQFP